MSMRAIKKFPIVQNELSIFSLSERSCGISIGFSVFIIIFVDSVVDLISGLKIVVDEDVVTFFAKINSTSSSN